MSYKWLALATVGIGTFMAPLDASVVNIALPQIAGYFGADVTVVEWVVMSYLLVISSLLLSYGRLGDMIGHKPVYISGFAIFTAGSLLCGLSQTVGQLIAFRVVQGFGAGMMMAIGPAIVTDAFPPAERGKALGINGMTVALGLAVGPTLGGLLAGNVGWRSIFYINLPIGIFGILWAARVLRWARPAGRQRFDLAGATTLMIALLALLLALSQGQNWGWHSTAVRGLLLLAVIFIGVFIVIERLVPQPMMDLGLFRNRLFAAASASALLNFMAQSVITLLMPFYLQNVRGLAPQEAGAVMTAFPLVVFLVAPISGSLSDRIGSRLLSSLGMAVLTFAILMLSHLQPTSDYLQVILPLGLAGLGAAMFQSPNNSALMGSVPRDRLGIGSGMLATMRNAGMVMGTALGGAIYASRLLVHLKLLAPRGYSDINLYAQAFTAALRDAYLTAAGLAALGVITSLVRGRMQESANSGGVPLK